MRAWHEGMPWLELLLPGGAPHLAMRGFFTVQFLPGVRLCEIQWTVICYWSAT